VNRDDAQIVIVGAAETTELGHLPHLSAIQLHADAARNAVSDCGVGWSEIDGLACAGLSPVAVAHYLGLAPTYIDGTSVGGSSFMLHVRHAAAALRAGLCRVVLITHGESGRSRVGTARPPVDPQSLQGQFEAPYGPSGPPSAFTIGVLRYMKEFGLTEEELATVAVVQRQWAGLNPRALMRAPITVEDVLSSPLIAYPMHRLECCLVTDGGGALVVTTAETARSLDLRQRPVTVAGAGEAAETSLISQMEDFTTSRSFRTAGRLAFDQAGISHADVDHVMLYDAFAHLPIYALEDLGFLPRGEAGGFIAAGNTAPGGRLPVNTNGGGLSYTHTGMYGMFAIQEAVRQLRGTAAAQIKGAGVSVVHGPAGYFGAAGTLVLTNRQ